jgi:phosphoglycerate dehydrogenase-like enzyme
MMKAALIGNTARLHQVFGEEDIDRLRSIVDLVGIIEVENEVVQDLPASFAEVEIIFSTWGMPVCDRDFLDLAPKLRAVFYAAGSAKSWVRDPVWEREIRIFTAADANARPVAEYCLAATIFGLKKALTQADDLRHGRQHWGGSRLEIIGGCGATVGVVSLSRTGRLFSRLARSLDVRLLAYDPVVDPCLGRDHVDELVSLAEIFRRSDVVSIHAPSLPETTGMITGALMQSLKPNAVFINTSRGDIVRENELVEVLKERADLFAYLDVTHPEPPRKDHELFRLPNVLVTPHLAGSLGNEQRRLSSSVIDAFERFLFTGDLDSELRQDDLLWVA